MGKLNRIPAEVDEMLKDFVTSQLQNWALCRENYSALMTAKRRNLKIGDFPVTLQFNPARIRSTGAKTDSKSIKERACFLCDRNRPSEQFSERFTDDFQILVNPYPIFPLHLTISTITHRPQTNWPLEMISLAESMPGICCFYNGARAGASAPDHLHFQATATCELPLVELVESCHSANEDGLKLSTSFGLDLPFGFMSWVIPANNEGMSAILSANSVMGCDRSKCDGIISHELGKEAISTDLINAYTWIDPAGKLRIVLIPRSAHRPDCYFSKGTEHHLVSPGAVDMAGLIILPREEDFDSLNEAEIEKIYAQTALTQDEFYEVKDILLRRE
ncbi:MAG: DUF4922 domain-containing protein [Prevotella sp.]|nr:DUF4922 domain-containing protein [Bacteroides sp.]MCM1365694.1 DUF4922 domain-containing protein [Prevotella sp.]MCM1437148.1 DUF4922 domain-containing protein [Prevotella sp.]